MKTHPLVACLVTVGLLAGNVGYGVEAKAGNKVPTDLTKDLSSQIYVVKVDSSVLIPAVKSLFTNPNHKENLELLVKYCFKEGMDLIIYNINKKPALWAWH